MSESSIPEAFMPQETPSEQSLGFDLGNDKKKSKFFDPKYRGPRRFFFVVFTLAVLGVLAFIIYAAWELPPMNEIENPQSDLSTQLLSADGKVLQKYYTRENRVNLELHEISPYVIDALLATEDVRFYQHAGIDPKSFFSILLGYLKTRDMRGGSTIDMQLTRNLYGESVGNQTMVVRKIKEYFVSAYIERRYTKREIMAAYLNTVNIYGTSYGIETTSNKLFDKSAKDLTVEEAALLVGMLKGQGVYNPIKYPERTKERRNVVIDQMIKYNFLDPQTLDIDSVKALPVTVVPQDQEHIKGLAPYFREHLRTQLRDWCKKNGYDLYTDGLRVYTTIDSRMQKHAEAAVRQHLSELQPVFDEKSFGKSTWRTDSASVAKMFRSGKWKGFWKKKDRLVKDLQRQSDRYQSGLRAKMAKEEIEKSFEKPVKMTVFSWAGPIRMTMTPLDSIKYYAGFLETGFASIDPSNGHVKAWVGGNDYKYFKYDHVYKGKRQVGSTFKPFVYATAIDNGYTPCDKELNQPVIFEDVDGNGARWVPKNSTGGIGGLLTLQRGLAKSVNLITARLMKKLGPNAVARTAYDMGIKSKLDEVPSLCLGTTDLSVYELAGAYCTFPNYGNAVEPMLILRIEDRNGKVLQEFSTKTKEVLTEEKAYMMTELLRGVVDVSGGTAHRLRFKYDFDTEIGGKTGTTQDQSDGWFMGFVPNLVSGVWVGCSDRRMRFPSIKEGQGANMALPIWALYMKGVYEDYALNFPKERFRAPEGFNIEINCPVEQDTNGPKKPGQSEGDADSF